MTKPILDVKDNVNIASFTTLRIPTRVRHLIRIRTAQELDDAVGYAAQNKLPIFVLGSGSNIVFGMDTFDGVVLKIEIDGLTEVNRDKSYTVIEVGAGHNWDAFVLWSVNHGLAGIESLSIVPGTVGAAPVQNVGCYGQEVSGTITKVKAFDLEKKTPVVLNNADCQFGYRDSVFKRKQGKRYVITHVTFRLVKAELAPVPQYASLQAELDRRKISGRPTLKQIREAVIVVRHSKLPDPAKIPTVGSFFHNAIISQKKYQELLKDFSDIPHFPFEKNNVKVPAAWLIESCGLRGYLKNGVGMYEKQAVALVNPGRRSSKEVLEFRDFVAEKVFKKFGIKLQMEPQLVV